MPKRRMKTEEEERPDPEHSPKHTTKHKKSRRLGRCGKCYSCRLGQKCVGRPKKQFSALARDYFAAKCLIKAPGMQNTSGTSKKRPAETEQNAATSDKHETRGATAVNTLTTKKRRTSAGIGKKTSKDSDSEYEYESSSEESSFIESSICEESSSTDYSASEPNISVSSSDGEPVNRIVEMIPATTPRKCDFGDQVKVLQIQLSSLNDALESERAKHKEEVAILKQKTSIASPNKREGNHKNTIAQLKDKIERIEKDNAGLKKNCEEVEGEVANYKKTINSMKTRMEGIEKDNADLRKRNEKRLDDEKGTKRRIERTQQENSDMKKTIDTLEKENKALKSKSNKGNSAGDSEALKQCKTAIRFQKDKIEGMEKEIKELRGKSDSGDREGVYKSTISNLKKKIEEMEKADKKRETEQQMEAEELKNTIHKLQEKIKNLEKENQELEKRNAREPAERRNEIENFKSLITKLREKIKALEKENQELADMYTREESERENEAAIYKSMISEIQKQITSIERKNEELQERTPLDNESFQNQIQGVLKENEELKRQIQIMEKERQEIQQGQVNRRYGNSNPNAAFFVFV